LLGSPKGEHSSSSPPEGCVRISIFVAAPPWRGEIEMLISNDLRPYGRLQPQKTIMTQSPGSEADQVPIQNHCVILNSTGKPTLCNRVHGGQSRVPEGS